MNKHKELLITMKQLYIEDEPKGTIFISRRQKLDCRIWEGSLGTSVDI